MNVYGHYEHAWQIRKAYGLRVFEGGRRSRGAAPVPGWSRVDACRGAGGLVRSRGGVVAAQRMNTALAAAATAVDPMLPGRLRASLVVPDGSRFLRDGVLASRADPGVGSGPGQGAGPGCGLGCRASP